ncbi:MAG TPA: hypothetical protein VFW38_10130 [Solirubrobacteraceae bacterium]|nr:hypothetical protein [Solirubrobacteraceae bacterium]
MDVQALSWSNPSCRDIGRALLHARDRELTAPRIEEMSGRSSVKRKAEKMVGAGMLEQRQPPCPSARQVRVAGRPPTVTFFLPETQVPVLQEALIGASRVGQTIAGQHVVFVQTTGDALVDVFATLDSSLAVAKASWSVMCHGHPDELAIVFTGDDAENSSVDLMMELAGAELVTRRAVLGIPASSQALFTRARRAARSARRSRLSHSTRRIA